MFEQLSLRSFKCFRRLVLPLSPLTLLAGSNASGKSSVLQALVLLHQTIREQEWSTRLMLNGESVRLGTVTDVVDKVYGRRSFEIGVVYSGRSYGWMLGGEREEMSLAIESVILASESIPSPTKLRFLLPPDSAQETEDFTRRLRGLSYITAERVGPREIYTLEDRQLADVVGPAGEHAISVLHSGRDEQVLPQLVLQAAPSTRLRQVEERMRTFFPGFAMELEQVVHANAVTLGIRTSDQTDFHRPAHVGFGLTQVLPIVIAALSTPEGGLLLIENPEVHLHPAGQAYMGRFLGEVALAGIQVVLETHSDHVLNGIRRFVRSELLPADDVAIHFFQPRSEKTSQVISPRIDNYGNLDSWPDGFFDQFDKDMNYFAGWEQ
jgi:predicted ATPase